MKTYTVEKAKEIWEKYFAKLSGDSANSVSCSGYSFTDCKKCVCYKRDGHENCSDTKFVSKYIEQAENFINEVDWSKVAVDTKIYVRNREYEDWSPRYFAKYEGGNVYGWVNGATSFSAIDKGSMTSWEFAKLAENKGE